MRRPPGETPAGGCSSGAFSPATGTTATTTSVDVRIGALGANYIVFLQTEADELTARVEFDFQGNIFVIDDLGAPTGPEFVNTGVAWTPGVYRTLSVTVDAVTNSITYTYNGTQIYTGVAGVFDGTTVEQVVFGSDNSSNGEVGNFDNLSVVATPVPEPALSLVVLAAAAGLAVRLRRRRAAPPVG